MNDTMYQKLKEMVAQAINDQSQWDEPSSDSYAEFHVDYEFTDNEHEGSVDLRMRPWALFEVIHDEYKDDIIDSLADKMNDAETFDEEFEVMNQLIEEEDWDLSCIYELIENRIISMLTLDLFSEVSDLLALNADGTLNINLE